MPFLAKIFTLMLEVRPWIAKHVDAEKLKSTAEMLEWLLEKEATIVRIRRAPFYREGSAFAARGRYRSLR